MEEEEKASTLPFCVWVQKKESAETGGGGGGVAKEFKRRSWKARLFFGRSKIGAEKHNLALLTELKLKAIRPSVLRAPFLEAV